MEPVVANLPDLADSTDLPDLADPTDLVDLEGLPDLLAESRVTSRAPFDGISPELVGCPFGF